MKTISNILGVIIACVLICAAGMGAYLGFRFIVRNLSTAKFYVEPITAMTWGVALVAALIIANSIRRAGQENAARHLVKEKAEAYQVFVSLWSAFLNHEVGAERRNHPKAEEDLKSLDGLLALCASAGVVRAHAVLRGLERTYGVEDQRVWAQFAVALVEIRRDLGLEKGGLNTKDLANLLFAGSAQVQPASTANIQHGTQPRVSLAPN